MKAPCSNPIGIFDPAQLYGTMYPVDVCGRFVLRNINPEEIDLMGDKAKESPFTGFRHAPIPPILGEKCCVLEITDFSLENPTPENPAYRQMETFLMRALTLLRLTQAGRFGFVFSWMLGRDNYSCSSVNIALLAKSWEARRANAMPLLPANVLPLIDRSVLDPLVSELWDKEIETDRVVRWFNKSFPEIHLEDKLIDLVFALEQVYLRGEGVPHYLSYKFAQRCACLLAENAKNRKQIFSDAREGYSKRSKIVHQGATLEPDQGTLQLITKLEEYLRQSLLIYLGHRPPFDWNPKNQKHREKIRDFWDDLVLSATK